MNEKAHLDMERDTISFINSNECIYYSITFDESPILKKKVYVCTVRITTKTSIIERVLYIDCFENDVNIQTIIQFLKERFDKMNLQKCKTVCITTDGSIVDETWKCC